MRLGGRLSAAIEILDDMDKRHRPAADALRDWGVAHRFAGSGDRAAIGNIVYDALRFRASSHWRFGTEGGRAGAFGALLTGFSMTPETVAAALDGDKFAPDPLSETEMAAWASRPLADAPGHVQAELPEWCAPMFEAAFGADWIAEGRALAARPPLDLRANTLKASREKALKALDRAGAAASAFAPQGMRIPPVVGEGRHPNVVAEPAFQKGWFEVQDEGSQIVAELAVPPGAAQILDYCAGGGGKTLAIAAALGNKGQVHASDADKTRLAPIFERLRRAGTRNVQVHAAGDQLDALESACDVVLVDAPCTGSGTWRRRPDTKWRLTQQSLSARTAEQAAVLDSAARYVKPGGRLVYVTCSVFSDENTAQAEAFRVRNGDFAPADDFDAGLARIPGLSDAARPAGDAALLLSPGKTGTDGFFIAALRRQQ